MQSLKDRTFVITGGTSDIGRALVLSLSARGADIAILDASPEKGRRLTDEISDNREVKEHHGKAAYFNTDLTNRDAIKESFSRAAETFGAIDILVSAFQQSKISSAFGAEYLADMEKLVDINLKSAVYATYSIVPFMKGRKKGKIIYIVPDLIRWGVEEESLSALTRGGLVYYAKALSRDLSPFNITVLALARSESREH
jgi:2-hydroxycyclohexanecarboxyl-CoA dehydrogenase